VKIVCFGCGKGMGDADVDPTDEIKFMYAMHKGCETKMRFQSEWNVYNEHVKKQIKLPKKGDDRAGVAPSV